MCLIKANRQSSGSCFSYACLCVCFFSWPVAIRYASPISVTVGPLQGCDEGDNETVVNFLSYFREQHSFMGPQKGTSGLESIWYILNEVLCALLFYYRITQIIPLQILQGTPFFFLNNVGFHKSASYFNEFY